MVESFGRIECSLPENNFIFMFNEHVMCGAFKPSTLKVLSHRWLKAEIKRTFSFQLNINDTYVHNEIKHEIMTVKLNTPVIFCIFDVFNLQNPW